MEPFVNSPEKIENICQAMQMQNAKHNIVIVQQISLVTCNTNTEKQQMENRKRNFISINRI